MKGIVVRRLLCAAAVIGCAVLIGFRGGTAAYMLLWVSLLIPVLSAVYQSIISQRLRVIFRTQEHTVLRGERVGCSLSIVNDSAFPISDVHIKLTTGKLRFADLEDELRCSLKPGEAKRIDLELDSLHCGVAQVGAESLLVQDIFALSEKRFSAVSKINVLPRAQHIQDLIVAPMREAERQYAARSYYGDTMPDGQLKPYAPGDDVRRIHWKASVLQGKPIMRNLIPEPKNEVVLLPDARDALPEGQAGWLAEDSIVEGTLAIADYFLRHHIALRVVPDAVRAVNVFAPSNYNRLYEVCSTDYFSGSSRPDDLLEQDMTTHGGGRSYIILTWELDEAFIRRCSDCMDMGAQISVVFIGDDANAASLAAADKRIVFHRVTAQNDIFAVLSGSGTTEAAE